MTNKIFDDYGIRVNQASSSPAAGELIRRKTFDLAVYDDEVPGAMELAAENGVRSAPRMVFAVVRNETVSGTHGKRIHFVVQKPCSSDLFAKSLRAAYGVMLREKRAAKRHIVRLTPTSCIATHKGEERSLKNATVVDISQTGLCLQAEVILPQGADIQVNLAHPIDRHPLQLTGTVIWSLASGRGGIRFTGVLPPELERLKAWLDSLLPGDHELLPKGMVQLQATCVQADEGVHLYERVLGAK
jgi:hypothetical protein